MSLYTCPHCGESWENGLFAPSPNHTVAICREACVAKIATLRGEHRKALAEADDLQRSFDLRWDADMRAIKRWQAEDSEARELIWPDHADLCVWLLEQLRAMHRRAQKAEANPKPLGDQHEGCRHEMRRYWERRRRWALRLIAISKGLGAQMVAAGVPDWFLDINGKRCEHGKRDPVVLLERLIAQRDEARERVAKLGEALRGALRRGYAIAVTHVEIREWDGWHRTAPFNEWDTAQRKLDAALAEAGETTPTPAPETAAGYRYAPRRGWVCRHCDETFATEKQAIEHGRTVEACQ